MSSFPRVVPLQTIFPRFKRESSTIDNRSGRNDRVQPFERLFRFFFLIFQYRVEELRFREVKLFWWERFLLREFILIYLFCSFQSFTRVCWFSLREILDIRNVVLLKQFGKVSKARLRVDCWLIESFDI